MAFSTKTMNTAGLTTKDIRKSLRASRRQLSIKAQSDASLQVCRNILRLPRFIKSQSIAVYFPSDGEVDLHPLIEHCWRLKKSVFLPVLHPFKSGELIFMPYTLGAPLAKNRFGIPEPSTASKPQIKPWYLDLVFTPLVGFDCDGNRMGMGGGFYDRTFNFMSNNLRAHNPNMVGIAHECQKVDSLNSAPWDIPMQWIVTPEQIYKGKSNQV